MITIPDALKALHKKGIPFFGGGKSHNRGINMEAQQEGRVTTAVHLQGPPELHCLFWERVRSQEVAKAEGLESSSTS